MGVTEALKNLPVGKIRSFPLSEVNVGSFRTKAGEFNTLAGFTKYSVSIDNLTQTLRIYRHGD